MQCNWTKSALTLVEEIFGAKNQLIQPRNISHKAENTENIKKTKDQNLLREPEKLILELTKVIGLFTSAMQAVLPPKLLCQYPQLWQIPS